MSDHFIERILLQHWHEIPATKEMDAPKDFEGTMIFVSHDRKFLRGLGSRVLEPSGDSDTDRNPADYPGS
jgi:hypothetical protein